MNFRFVIAAVVMSAGFARAAETQIPLPPAEHPRLYLRKEQLEQLAARFRDPLLGQAVARLERYASGSAQRRVEWHALQQLARSNPDPARSRAIVVETLAMLKKSELPKGNDGCRVTGRMMVTGAMVYD